MGTKINIVLFQPEIPQNTGNIIRTCVGTNAKLHLIKPYGFDLSLSDRIFKRNSTNYAEVVEIVEYENFAEFEQKNNPEDLYFLTRYGHKSYHEIDVKAHPENIYYVFGRESSGIDREILEKYEDRTFRIPMDKKMRSLNLSNCAALVAYDGLRQLDFAGLEFEEPHKINFWE